MTSTTSTLCPLQVVRSSEDFARIFLDDPSRSALLLCYEAPHDGLTPDDINTLHASLSEHSQHVDVTLYVWDCTSDAFTAAKTQLSKQKGKSLLVIVQNGAVADLVHCSSGTLAQWARENVARVCELLALRQGPSRKPASIVTSHTTTTTTTTNTTTITNSGDTLRVDVARMMELGTRLMQRGQADYAEKVFCKALNVLDTLRDEVDVGTSGASDDETLASYDASVALCLAWAAIAQLVQGKQVEHNVYIERLMHDPVLQTYCEQPLSEACRACVLAKLMRAAPRSWSVDTTNNEQEQCSLRTLRAKLAENPHDMDSRCMLLITLFLAGDMECALTEAVKLTQCSSETNNSSSSRAFGVLALRELRCFLGEEHELVRQLHLIVPT